MRKHFLGIAPRLHAHPIQFAANGRLAVLPRQLDFKGGLNVEKRAYGLHELSANRLRILKVEALQRLADYYALPLRARPLI